MSPTNVVVLIPESTRKARGGDASATPVDGIVTSLPAPSRKRLESLREELRSATKGRGVEPVGLLPAYRRYDGNMYRRIDVSDWERRDPGVEVVIVSGLLGLVASRDTIPAYVHSMAEPMPPFGKLNRWWHEHGLPDVLGDYLIAVHPPSIVDLLSLEYREAVAGFGDRLKISVKTIDFPGMGRASQPARGKAIAKILRTGRA